MCYDRFPGPHPEGEAGKVGSRTSRALQPEGLHDVGGSEGQFGVGLQALQHWKHRIWIQNVTSARHFWAMNDSGLRPSKIDTEELGQSRPLGWED